VIRFHDVLEDEWHYYLVTEFMVRKAGGGRERGERKDCRMICPRGENKHRKKTKARKTRTG